VQEQVFVNPVLTPIGDRTVEFRESCLSVPGLSAEVRRWHAVRVHALDETGARGVELDFEGWPARILQHELDHLNGVLYVDRDRMDPLTLSTSANVKRWWKARSADEIRAAMRAGAR
jgi:peptide deformylase